MRSETMADVQITPLELKLKANEFFTAGNYLEAIDTSLKAISITASAEKDLISVLHKNTAAYYLKINKFEDALKHCDNALDISPQDPKTLYRRATALEGLERYEEAYRDAQKALLSSPADAKTFTPLLSRLHIAVEKRRNKFAQVKEKASEMIKFAFDPSSNEEERETGLNNVLVLCRERAGLEALLDLGLLEKLKSLLHLKSSATNDMRRKITAIRTISEAVRFSVHMCKRILGELGIPFFVTLQDLPNTIKSNRELVEEVLTPIQYLWQSVLDALSGTKKNEKPNQELMKENMNLIETFLKTLAVGINSRSILPEARDVILQLFIKIIDVNSISWGQEFMDTGALERLIDVACEVPELKSESTMGLTSNTKNLTSVLLSRVYDNLCYDAARNRYIEIVDSVLKNLLLEADFEAKIKSISVLTCLLLGPIDVGNTVLGRAGILQMILVMANSENVVQQRVASEAIVAAASKKDKAKGIITEGINILKRLYQSPNEEIKVRALVGLCKLGSTGGTDASWKPFEDGANLKLADACRRFLVNSKKELSIQKWAIEGLSYLTLDAEVKEKLVEDQRALKALLDLSIHASQMGDVLYPIITCLVNLVNAYDKQELVPEMVELAKFAKHHIPEEHEFDDPDFVEKRVEVLVDLGVTNCLVNLSKATESANTLELIARILNAICEKEIHRGKVVAGGGARELIRVSQTATEKGKRLAAQAISRIGISQPPSVAFPGQRSFEVVKPLLSLLEIDCSALQNFEALLALCNLAGESEDHRKRILQDGGLGKIEHYIYEDHQMLRRSAVQLMVNLSLSERIVELFEGENDRVKYMLLLSSSPEDLDEEDKEEIETMKAASAVLAIVSNGNRKICGKILTCVKNSLEILIWLVANPIVDLQLRGVSILKNILEVDRDLAEQIVGTPVFEVLMALTQSEVTKKETDSPEITKQRYDIRKRAQEALTVAEKWGLIEKN